MLTSSDWVTLDDSARVLAVACMLVASRSEGQIDGSEVGLAYLKRVAYLNKTPNIKPLIECGFLECASECKQKIQNAIPETEGLTEGLTEVLKETTLFGKPNGHLKIALEVLNFLNAKTGRHYKPVKANLAFIVGRLKDGATETELRQVVAKKTREWKGDPVKNEYLRPATLFNATKFAQYQGELLQPEAPDAVS